MEKNIHHDPLDDYVRRSFDDHEENPASDMWSRIEAELPDAPPGQTWRVFLLRNRLRLAAAVILLLLSGLVCEHFYYENKLRDLATQAHPLQKQQETVTPEIVANTDQSGPGKKQPLPRMAPVGSTPRVTTPPPTPPPAGRGASARKTETTVGKPPLSTREEVSHSAITALPQPEYQPISLNQAPLPAGGGGGGGVPARALSGWYIGLHATPQRTFETATPTAHQPGMRPVFTGQSEHPEVATGWWLRIGKSVGRRWGLESGIGFSESTRTTAHTARFRFADGDIHPGGPGPIGQRRNFSYDLNTYGGSASVSLRMESADASAPVTDAEPVVVKISTTEHAQLLRIPLLLTHRMGSGRLTVVAKAGLTGNFFLKNDLAISARTSQNNRLRFAQNTDNFAFERSGNFFLGYWASAGLEYRWNRSLSLVAEPAVSGNFARKDAQGRRLPDQVLAGVNVGLNWRL
jgi:hypothetical protein